jgi:beta-barrel assembly-enhancing protease
MHRRSSIRRTGTGVLLVALLAGACVARNVPPIGAEGKPFTPDSDERALWTRAEKEEEALLKRTKVYDDPLLEGYLAGLTDRLTPDSVRAAGAPAVKVIVIRDATLNAFTMPNGHIYVHTGLLSRLDNEAQLATVLGHELTHYAHRHALKVSRSARTAPTQGTTAVASGVGVAVAATAKARATDQGSAAVLSQTASAILGLGLELAIVGAINGYGRDLEREADDVGMAALVRAGYDPREAPKAFQIPKSEIGQRGTIETFFLGSAAPLQDRVTNTTRLANTTYAKVAANDRTRNTDDFDLRLRPVVRENAYEDIRLGRYALAEGQLGRVLLATPNDPVTHLYYGDLHRLRAQRAKSAGDRAVDSQRARERYERAAELDPAYPDPWRQLGFLYFQTKDRERARTAFEKYIELRPDAPDVRRIKEYLTELDRP